MQDLFELNDLVAVVTGGAGVLGGALVDSLAAAGVRVGVLGRTVDKVAEKARAVSSIGGQALALTADVLKPDQLAEAHGRLLAQWGRVDVLINAAGGNMPGATIGPGQSIFDLSIDDFDAVTRLNLQGTVLPTLTFGRSMAEQGRGSIINISSMAAQQALTRVVGYSASKAAVDNFTRWMAVELALKYGEGVRVNAIAPGFFIGKQNRRLLLQEDGAYTARGQTIIDQTPMKRFGRPDELCGVVHWLAGPGASFVTGVVIPIDGGFSAYSGV